MQLRDRFACALLRRCRCRKEFGVRGNPGRYDNLDNGNGNGNGNDNNDDDNNNDNYVTPFQG